MESLTRHINSLEEMEHEARSFVEKLQAQAKTSGATPAILVTLSGELGVGKTTFTQFVAKTLGVIDVVNSPTFVLEKIYTIHSDDSSTFAHSNTGSEKLEVAHKFSKLVHIDAYRLQSADDLLVLNFAELLAEPKTLILLEWPERVAGIAEQASVQILLELLPDGSRQITYA